MSRIVVCGVPRSGTSMMMQSLVAAGVEPWHEPEFRPTDRRNPQGYFEHGSVIRDRSTDCPSGRCVKVVGDDAVKFVRSYDKVILMTRSPAAISASQDEMGFPFHRTPQMIAARIDWLRDSLPGCFVADYDFLVDTLDFSDVARYTGLSAERMSSVVIPSLRHHQEVLP